MAVGADLDVQILAERRASGESVAAGAGDRHVLIFRMDRSFHRSLTTVGGAKGRASLAAHWPLLKQSCACLSKGLVAADVLHISTILYPQKLWISLWTYAFFKVRIPGRIAFLLHWLIIDQYISPSIFNKLHSSYSATWLV
jgi:hypothetical protein